MLAPAVLLGATMAAHAVGVASGETLAAGQVTDSQGRPIAGARVQAKDWHGNALGSANGDAQGRFELPLSQPVKDLSLTVEHPGYQRWALASASPDEDGSYRIRLTRTIGPEYLAELAAQPDPSRFHWLARDLLAPSMGTVGDTLPLGEVLPFLKALRPRLRALLPEKPSHLKKKDLPEAQRRAVLLLAYLGDPGDDALVEAWAKKQNFISRPPKPCRGATPDAAVREWQEAHFEKEGYGSSQPVPYHTVKTQIAPRGDHGLALLTVRYAHWGYSQHGVLVNLNGVWEVRWVIDNQRWHGPS